MKHILVILMILCMLFAFSACGQVGLSDTEATPNPYEERIAELEAQLAEAEQNNEVNVAQDLQPNQVVTPTPAPTPSPTPAKPAIDNPQMYSSYAHLVSLDATTGYAQFDYFEQLTGDEAVDALVKYEGYDDVDAQAEVMNWGEGGFYEKNTDSQLRTVDLNTVDIRLIIKSDGMLIDDLGNPPKSTFADILKIYNADKDYITDFYFYWVTVNDKGVVTKIEQVYRP
jgi:hypothetical protein